MTLSRNSPGQTEGKPPRDTSQQSASRLIFKPHMFRMQRGRLEQCGTALHFFPFLWHLSNSTINLLNTEFSAYCYCLLSEHGPYKSQTACWSIDEFSVLCNVGEAITTGENKPSGKAGLSGTSRTTGLPDIAIFPLSERYTLCVP
jgi:hypothetical protein